MDDTQFSQYQQALDSDKSTDNNSDGGGSGTTHTLAYQQGAHKIIRIIIRIRLLHLVRLSLRWIVL